MLKSHGRLWLLTSSRVWGFILCTLSFKASTVLHGCSFDNFVALPADVFKILIYWGSYLRDILGKISSLAPASCNFASISRVCFLPSLLSGRDPVVFSLLTKYCTLCLLGSDFFENWHQNFPLTFSSRLIFETELHYTHAIFNMIHHSSHAVTAQLNGKCITTSKHNDSSRTRSTF